VERGKWKEGDKGTKSAGETKEEIKEKPKPCISKKQWYIKGRPEEENFVKKQASPGIQHAYPLSKKGIQ
jgi:hypothetical protein